MNYHKTRVAAAVSTALSIALLTGCGGGGGGGGGTTDAAPVPEPDTYVFPAVRPADTVTESESGVANPSEVVAVIDSGVDLGHDEFQGNNPVGKSIVTTSVDSASTWCTTSGGTDCGDPNDVADEHNHGTAVASLIAGRTQAYSGNSQIAVYDVSDRSSGTTVASSWVSQALSDLVDNGNRVANLSYQIDMVSVRQGITDERRARVDKFVDSGAVLVSAAGNESRSYSSIAGSSWSDDLAEANSLVDQYLVVGALDGDELASYSNYAGDNPLVQSRFLVTQGRHYAALANGNPDDYGLVQGTSFAAPIVSAAMASMLSKWDHLTPAQAAQRLLDTTDREFANKNDNPYDNYGDTGCSAAGNLDCGLVTYGQGRLDIEAAMAPEGIPAIATAASVPDANHKTSGSAIDQSGVVLPAGLGDAATQIKAAVAEVEVFDDLGRNYTADLSGMVQTHTDPTQGLGFRMSQFLASGLSAPLASFSDKATGTRQIVGVDASGRLNLAAVGTDTDAWGIGFTAYHFGGGASAPDASGFQPMGMVSYAGNTPMANQIDSANGVNVDLPLVKGLSLTSAYWQGEKRLSLDATGKTNRIDNIQVGLKAEVVHGVHLTAGFAQLNESAGFMGMTGMGGFSTDSGSSMNLMQVGLNARFGGFRAFANYQTGKASAAFSNSLITNLDADVEQMALGAAYGFDQGRRQVAFVASQPLHLTGGNADMRLAVDRTGDGQVIYRSESVAFSGADAPMNYEIGYRQRVGKRTMLGLNAMRMENAPNMATGGADHGAMAMVQYRF